ncbi:MAG: hypothetical protein Q7S60_01975 [bacterium]|nr:hypothetical protein [bacterium]
MTGERLRTGPQVKIAEGGQEMLVPVDLDITSNVYADDGVEYVFTWEIAEGTAEARITADKETFLSDLEGSDILTPAGPVKLEITVDDGKISKTIPEYVTVSVDCLSQQVRGPLQCTVIFDDITFRGVRELDGRSIVNFHNWVNPQTGKEGPMYFPPNCDLSRRMTITIGVNDAKPTPTEPALL